MNEQSSICQTRDCQLTEYYGTLRKLQLTSGGKHEQSLTGAKRLQSGAKRPGGETSWGRNVQGAKRLGGETSRWRNVQGAKRPVKGRNVHMYTALQNIC